MAYITHRLGKTHYIARGKVKRSIPLIALHGGPGGTSRSTAPLLRLSSERRVYIYDQIGSGKSSATSPSKWTMKTFVDELKLLIEAWGLTRFHLFGVSCGSTLALDYYLATRDKKIASIIFQSPFFSARDWQRDADFHIQRLPKRYQKIIHHCQEVGATDSKVYAEALEAYYLKHVVRNKKAFRAERDRKNPNGKKVYAYMWGPSEFCPTGSLHTYNKASKLKKVKAPVLFISGQYDEIRPTTVKSYRDHIPNSVLQVIPGASHAIAAEKPRVLVKTLRNFFRSVES